jgi:tetratricopeptide (TPR) repeat protein
MSTTLLEIPGYRVHGQLGKGGMAEVFLATQESLSRKVAIKVLRSAEDESFSQRFVREAHIVASLNHPSIITIYDVDRLADGRYYLAMEFLPGGDLARHKGELFAPERALQIVRQIASGLAVVHDKGLVHRDVKPANVLFRDDGTAVLTDFGVAKDLDIDSELTQFGVAVGSPAYSSPEQAQCQALDARSDIYSLGVILLEMLTGNNPYRGGNYTQTVVNHVQMEPPLADSLGAFRGVLARMLAKQPEARYTDCRALLAALDEVELSDLDETQLRPALQLSESVPPAPASVPRQRRSAMPLLAGLTVLVLIGTLTFAGLYIKQQRQIAALLAQAEQRFAAGQLVEPQQDSAEHYFNQVLAIDEGSDEAQAGLQRIREARIAALLAQAEQRLTDGLLSEPAGDSAEHYYLQAQAIDPQHATVLAGLEKLLQARIARNLELAEQSIADKRLLLPEQDSALYYYRQILGWVPDNAEALTGITRVAEAYRDLARAAYRRGDFPAALAMIERGLEAEPQNAELLQMQGEHRQLLADARAASARAAADRAARAENEQREESERASSNPIKRVWNNIFGQ